MNTLLQIRTMVEEFHRAFDHPVVHWSDASPRVAALRAELIREEFAEYVAADEDRTERVDALGDLAYVTAGAQLALGIRTNEYESPLLHTPVPSKRTWLLFAGEAQDAINELNKSDLCYDGLTRSTNNLLKRILDASALKDVPIIHVVREIHRSNMTKLWTERDLIKAPRDAIIKRRGPSSFAVSRPDGKIIKPPTYVKPNLQEF